MLRARNLLSKDLNGTLRPPLKTRSQSLLLANGVTGATTGFSDPFVEVDLRGGDAPQSVRTAVINKSLNPEWNAQLGLYARTDQVHRPGGPEDSTDASPAR